MAYPPILQRLLDLLARINAVLQEESDAEPIVTLSKWDETFLCQVPLPFLVNEAPAGWVPATGAVIEGAADRFPKAWARLQQSDMQHLLCSEADWQAASTQVYYTDAAGNAYSWDGVGGVCKYVQNLDTGTLRMMDLRGLHQEAAGYNTLAVGAVACDEMRHLTGEAHIILYNAAGNHGWGLASQYHAGAMTNKDVQNYATASGYNATPVSQAAPRGLKFDASRVAPVGPRFSPARYGVLPCAYLGS